MNESLIISIKTSKSTKDSVLIEQEPWDPFVDYLTKLGAVAYLNKLLYDSGDGAKPNCSSSNGICTTTVYMYPSRENLSYNEGLTYGVIGKRRVKRIKYSEVIQCNLQDVLQLKYPTKEITKHEWIGDAYSDKGELLAKPIITVSIDKLKLSKKVYGTLLVTYWVIQHIYSVTISPRPEAVENKSQSFVYAVWSGGNNAEEIKIPEAASSEECNNYGSGSDHFTHGDDRPESVPPEDQNEWVDYCDQIPTERPVIG